MMILYVLNIHIRRNEKTKDDPIHIRVDLPPRRSRGEKRFTNTSEMRDATIDRHMSIRKTTLVLRYLSTYLLKESTDATRPFPYLS